jgi:ABC-type transport system substrate-binding protein
MQQLLKTLATLLAAALLSHTALAQELKVLTYPRTGQFESLDPVVQFDEVSSELVEALYDKLLAYSYLERPYKLTPNLLAKMPELSADKLTYTFTLRQGVHFHDNPCFKDGKGREMTADDVLYSLKRYADANLNNKSWFAMEGAVVGLDDYRAATRKAAPGTDNTRLDVAGFKKTGSHSFTIKLTHPNPLFLFALAMSSTAVVPVEAVQKYKEQFGVNPVGTGPFTLKDIERKGVLRLLKNPNYHGVYPSVGEPGDDKKGLLKDAGKRLPLVDVVEMPLIEEAQPAALKFLKGELDWRGLDRANFTKLVVRNADGSFRVSDEYASKFNIYSTLGLDSLYMGINMKDPLLGQNKLLRQALVRLIDTRGRIDVLLNGRGRKLNSIVPYELPGNERDTGARYPEYDIAAAKKLLAEAGYPDGKGLPPLTMLFSATDADTRNLFDFYKARAALAGVQLKAGFMDNPTFIKNIQGGNFQIASYGWVADYADAEDFYQLLYSKNVAPGPNFPSFSNAAYDKAYEASRTMVNGPERYALFKTMNDIILDETPVILMFNSLRFGITQKWMSNFKRNLLVPEFAFIDIDMARKKKGL